MKKLIVAAAFALTFVGCASTPSDHVVARPEVKLDWSDDGTVAVYVDTIFYDVVDTINVTLTSTDKSKSTPLPAKIIGGRFGGGLYTYEAKIPHDMVMSMGGEAIITVQAGMADSGVVLRQYYVKPRLILELNPLAFNSDLKRVQHTFKDF